MTQAQKEFHAIGNALNKVSATTKELNFLIERIKDVNSTYSQFHIEGKTQDERLFNELSKIELSLKELSISCNSSLLIIAYTKENNTTILPLF